MIAHPGTKAARILELAATGYDTRDIQSVMKSEGIPVRENYIRRVLAAVGMGGTRDDELNLRIDNIETLMYQVWAMLKELTGLPEVELARRVKDESSFRLQQRLAAVRQRLDASAETLKQTRQAAAKRGRLVAGSRQKDRAIARRTAAALAQTVAQFHQTPELSAVPPVAAL